MGTSVGELTGITLRFADRIKLGGDEGSGPVLSGGSCECATDGNLEGGIEELEDSSLLYSLGSEG